MYNYSLITMYHKWMKSFQNIKEYHIPTQLKIIHGSVPRNIHGTYYKCGPGEFYKYDSSVAHPFDGDGYVSSYHFHSGKVYYMSRFVNTLHRQNEMKENKRLYMGAFGTEPHNHAIKNPGNTNVIPWNDELFVFCESGIPYRLDKMTLETLGSLKPFQEGLPIRTHSQLIDTYMYRNNIIGDIVCAHPKVIDDKIVFYSIIFHGKQSTITFFEIDKSLNIVSQTPYTIDGHIYFLHDFIVSNDYYVFIQHSLQFDIKNIKKGLVNCLHSDPNKSENTIHAVPRPNSSKPFLKNTSIKGFITHHITPPRVSSKYHMVFYSIMYPEIINWSDMDHMKEGTICKTYWNLLTNEVSQEKITDLWIEFPISDTDTNRLYSVLAKSRNAQGSLAKFSIEPFHKLASWDADEDSFLGEPMVDNTGHLLTTCYDANKNESYLYIFDTKYISNGPIAVLQLPDPVPVGLHGSWCVT